MTKMSIIVQRLKWYFILGLPICLGILAWQGWAWWDWASSPLQASSPSTATVKAKEVQIKIPPGTATQQIGRELETTGVIRSSKAWNLWARWLQWQDPQGDFKAGTYQLSPTEPLVAIAAKIRQGKVVEYSFTIPEGWSLRQMAAYFEQIGFFRAQDFLAAANQVDNRQYPWLPTGLHSFEGFLFPNTYKLSSARLTPQAAIGQMLRQFEQKALPLYQSDRTKLNLLQWVTLASIVEKEAAVPAERPRIAGVFTSRLRQGMRLESDPTVEYALGIRQTVAAPLTFAQVKTPSPYNTYVNPGLPPAPIASPGLASLKAALYPERTPYLYFVARYDGTHVFSRTLSEHQSAQATIRKQVAAQRR